MNMSEVPPLTRLPTTYLTTDTKVSIGFLNIYIYIFFNLWFFLGGGKSLNHVISLYVWWMYLVLYFCYFNISVLFNDVFEK